MHLEDLFSAYGWQDEENLEMYLNNFYSFTITPDAGRSVTITGVLIRADNANNNTLVIRTSLDNFQTNLSNVTVTPKPLEDIRISINPLANPLPKYDQPIYAKTVLL